MSDELSSKSVFSRLHDPIMVGKPNVALSDSLMQQFEDVLRSKTLSNNGPKVQELEKKIATYIGVEHCILVNNATIGLEILLDSLGISGEILMPSYTFIATAHSAYRTGLTPVFVDILSETHCIDIDRVKEAVNSNVSAILAVNLWGIPCDIFALEQLAKDLKIPLVFDSAHAFGSSFGDRMIGSFGTAEVFSFHATKFFNTFEGGAITTNDEALAKKLRLYRGFGIESPDNIVQIGTNAKLSEFHAVMGLANFEQLDTFVKLNHDNYVTYRESFSGSGIGEILELDKFGISNYQYLVLELDDRFVIHRDEIIAHFESLNVYFRKYFWPSCHNMQPYASNRSIHSQNSLSFTEKVADRVLILPTGSSVSADLCQEIAKELIRFCKTLIQVG
jgi:dTDP-4-amino-4,6-dideoxygalactose transaminase